MRPIAGDAEPDEFGALHLDPVRGEGPALAAEFDQGGGVGKIRLRLALGAVILLLDLPLDRQAVAVPAGHVIRIVAEHLLAARHHVLEDLVERVADMDVAIGVRRPVVEDEARPALGRRAQRPVKVELLPARQNLRLLLRQAGAHREVGLGQKQRFRVIARFTVGHLTVSQLGVRIGLGLLTSRLRCGKGLRPALRLASGNDRSDPALPHRYGRGRA